MSDDFDSFEENNSGSLLIDLEDVAEQSFELLPKGTYPVVVEECEFQISKSSGNPMWRMVFAITEGEYENRKLFHYMSFSEKALPMAKSALKVLASDLISSSFDPKGIADDGLMTGRTATARVDIQKGEGEYSDQNRIKSFLSAGASEDGDAFDV